MSDGAIGRDLIRKAMEREASDIHLTVGQRPHMRCDGELQAIGDSPLTENFLSEFCSSILNDSQRERLEKELTKIDFEYDDEINVFLKMVIKE